MRDDELSVVEVENVELDEIDTSEPVLPYPDLKGSISFEHVWFAYDADRWVLRDVTFDVPAGTRVGLVGHTGSGKSTLAALLMRFHEPQQGRILIAHRLATTRGCDQVLVLNKGQIVERGDHAHLLSLDGLYARLFRYQQVAES